MSGPRRVVTVVAVFAAGALVVFGWLWWRNLAEQSQMPSTLVDRLAASASMIEREIDAELDRWERMAASEDSFGALPAEGTLLLFGPEAVTAVRGEPLTYYPAVAKTEVPADERLVRAQEAEFRTKNLDAAIAAYRDAATSTARTVRAVATAGLARCLRAQGKTTEALAAYDELAQMEEARVDRFPAPLLAHRERRQIFEALGDSASAERERKTLVAELLARKYLIIRKTFEAFAGALAPGQYPQSALDRADAVTSSLWAGWRAAPSGRSLTRSGSSAFVSVWRTATAGSVAIVASADVLMAPAMTSASRLSTAIALEDPDGLLIWGEKPPGRGSFTVSLGRVKLSANLKLWISQF